MAQPGFDRGLSVSKAHTFWFMLLCIPERDEEPKAQSSLKGPRHQHWPHLLTQDFKGAWSWLGLEGGGEYAPFPPFPGLSPSLGQVGAGSVGTDPGSAYQGWRVALSWKPWLLPRAQERPSLPKLAGGSFWNGNSPHPPRLGTVFWQAYVLKSYRWCRHGLEGIPAGPPPRSPLITHQITLTACRIPGILAAPGNQLQGQQELLRS